jgi:hypothetical protein
MLQRNQKAAESLLERLFLLILILVFGCLCLGWLLFAFAEGSLIPIAFL